MVQSSVSTFRVKILFNTSRYLEFWLHNFLNNCSEAIVRRKLNFGPVVENMSIYWLSNIGRHKVNVIISVKINVERNKITYPKSVGPNNERNSSGVQGLD